MKKILFAAAFAALVVAGTSCKSKNDKATETTTSPATDVAPPPPPTAPVEVSTDDALRKGVTDATKDIKGLTARVDSGVIHLSGTISKEDNMRITPTLNSLRPKKINRDNLTVK